MPIDLGSMIRQKELKIDMDSTYNGPPGYQDEFDCLPGCDGNSMMLDTGITKHAKTRIVQRCGVNKKSVEAVADKALLSGLTHKDVSGSLARYLDKLYLSHGVANNMRIYGQKVFLFRGSRLITVVNLPARFHKTVNKIKVDRQQRD